MALGIVVIVLRRSVESAGVESGYGAHRMAS